MGVLCLENVPGAWEAYAAHFGLGYVLMIQIDGLPLFICITVCRVAALACSGAGMSVHIGIEKFEPI